MKGAYKRTPVHWIRALDQASFMASANGRVQSILLLDLRRGGQSFLVPLQLDFAAAQTVASSSLTFFSAQSCTGCTETFHAPLLYGFFQLSRPLPV